MSAEENHGGILVISIDGGLSEKPRDGSSPRDLSRMAERLETLFQRYRIAATWAVHEPAAPCPGELILASPLEHEIALLGDPSWAGDQAGRTHFAHELLRRTNAAQARGIDVTTLALRGVELTQHLDLLVKHKISVVRPADVDRRETGRLFRPQSLRYGVWQTPASCELPLARRPLLVGTASAVRRTIDRAIRTERIVHLALDGPRLMDANLSGLAAIEKVLRHAHKRRDQGQLAIKTLRRLVSRFTRRPCVPPSRSVLRPAA